MVYELLATSLTPALIIYLLDVSGSMGRPLRSTPKIDYVSKALQRSLKQLINLSLQGSTIAPVYRLAMIAYSESITDVWGGIITVADLLRNPMPLLPAPHGDGR